MLLSAEQARKTLCHETLEARRVSHNGDIHTEANGALCVAADCMAWRWFDHGRMPIPAGALPIPHYDDSQERRRGYCGKAGRATVP